jgi:RNA polymerase sigma-70 factor (ECF subfamily)
MDTAQPHQTEAMSHVEADDQALIHRFLDGQDSAFTHIVEKYRRQVYAVAYRFTRNAEEADDLTQETFIKAYENLHKFRGEASLKTWLLRITTNASINMTKSGRISKDIGEAPDEQLIEGEPDSPLGNMIGDERKVALRRAIGHLPPRQKQALLLKTYQEMSCEEVAHMMNCSVGTVKANVFNALKRLKTIMATGA